MELIPENIISLPKAHCVTFSCTCLLKLYYMTTCVIVYMYFTTSCYGIILGQITNKCEGNCCFISHISVVYGFVLTKKKTGNMIKHGRPPHTQVHCQRAHSFADCELGHEIKYLVQLNDVQHLYQCPFAIH